MVLEEEKLRDSRIEISKRFDLSKYPRILYTLKERERESINIQQLGVALDLKIDL